MKTLGMGIWEADIQSLAASLQQFCERHRLEKFGKYSFRFVILDEPLELAAKRWLWSVGSITCDHKQLYTIKDNTPHPDFEGWPYGKLEVLEVPLGLEIRMLYGTAHVDAIQAYLRLLQRTLIQHGLKIVVDMGGDLFDSPLDVIRKAQLELTEFKSLIERQSAEDLYVDGSPQENIARALLQFYIRPRSYREVQIRGGRSDLLAFTDQGRFLYETKIWNGSAYYEQGLREIEEYILGENDDRGLLYAFYIVFDKTKTSRASKHLGKNRETIEVCGHNVDVVIVDINLPTPSKKK